MGQCHEDKIIKLLNVISGASCSIPYLVSNFVDKTSIWFFFFRSLFWLLAYISRLIFSTLTKDQLLHVLNIRFFFGTFIQTLLLERKIKKTVIWFQTGTPVHQSNRNGSTYATCVLDYMYIHVHKMSHFLSDMCYSAYIAHFQIVELERKLFFIHIHFRIDL